MATDYDVTLVIVNEESAASAACDPGQSEERSKVEHEIPCQKAKLMEGSDYFRAMFDDQNAFLESKADRVVIRDVDVECMQQIVDFLHNGSTDLFRGNLQKVLRLALQLQVEAVVTFCSDSLAERLTKNTWYETLELANSLSLKSLRGLALDFVVSQFDTIVSTNAFDNLSLADLLVVLDGASEAMHFERLVLQGVVKWIEADVSERRVSETIRSLMQKIHFLRLFDICEYVSFSWQFLCDKLLIDGSYFNTLRKPCLEQKADWLPDALAALCSALHVRVQYLQDYYESSEQSNENREQLADHFSVQLLRKVKKDLHYAAASSGGAKPSVQAQLEVYKQKVRIDEHLIEVLLRNLHCRVCNQPDYPEVTNFEVECERLQRPLSVLDAYVALCKAGLQTQVPPAWRSGRVRGDPKVDCEEDQDYCAKLYNWCM